MRHLRKGRKFGRVRKQRKALLRNLAVSFFKHEKITTTEAKAKELRPFVERLITKAGAGNLDARRKLLAHLPESAVSKLMREIAPRFRQRPGGYTRLIKLGKRSGDSAELAILELV